MFKPKQFDSWDKVPKDQKENFKEKDGSFVYEEALSKKEAEDKAERMKWRVDRGNYDYTEAEKEINENDKIKEIVNKLAKKFNINHVSSHVEGQLSKVSKKFGGLDNVKGKRILDLGCGSVSGTFETDNFNELDRQDGIEPTRTFEPWLCRALVELGANPVGIDIGNLEGEEFEHFQIDLSKPGALDFLPDKSFDGANMRLFLTSPHLEQMTNKKKRDDIGKEMDIQMKRLLKDDGKLIETDLDHKYKLR